MKKKLFSVLAVLWLTLFGFTNADSVSFSSINWDYSPKTLVLTKDYSFNSDTVINNSCSLSRCELAIIWGGKRCYITSSNWNLYFDWCSNLPARSYTLSNCAWNGFDWCYNSITLKLPNPPIVQWGTDAFSGVLTSVSSSISEFIPYIVYIWIGLLGACIWFVAIKRLLNRLKSKVLNPFRK